MDSLSRERWVVRMARDSIGDVDFDACSTYESVPLGILGRT